MTTDKSAALPVTEAIKRGRKNKAPWEQGIDNPQEVGRAIADAAMGRAALPDDPNMGDYRRERLEREAIDKSAALPVTECPKCHHNRPTVHTCCGHPDCMTESAALPVTEAGRALLDDGHSILQHAYSPCTGDCWLGRGIKRIETEAYNSGVLDQKLSLGQAEAAQARDGELWQQALNAESKRHHIHSESYRALKRVEEAARALIESKQ